MCLPMFDNTDSFDLDSGFATRVLLQGMHPRPLLFLILSFV